MKQNLRTIHIEEGFYNDIYEIALKYRFPIKGVSQMLLALGLERWEMIDKKLLDEKRKCGV